MKVVGRSLQDGAWRSIRPIEVMTSREAWVSAQSFTSEKSRLSEWRYPTAGPGAFTVWCSSFEARAAEIIPACIGETSLLLDTFRIHRMLTAALYDA